MCLFWAPWDHFLKAWSKDGRMCFKNVTQQSGVSIQIREKGQKWTRPPLLLHCNGVLCFMLLVTQPSPPMCIHFIMYYPLRCWNKYPSLNCFCCAFCHNNEKINIVCFLQVFDLQMIGYIILYEINLNDIEKYALFF